MLHFESALITGASSGLGHAIALELARRGTRRIALLARRREPMEELARQLQSLGAEARVEVLDVVERERVIELVQQLDREFGGFDLVLANSGVGGSGRSQELEFSVLQQTMEVNALGAMATLWAAMGPMLERGRGTLAGMSSIASQRGLPGSGAYCASKAALTTWLDTLRADLRSTGVRVTDIRPGFVRTPMTDNHEFKMPFLVELDVAARRCVRDLQRGKPVCTFPAPMAWLLWSLHRLPDFVWRMIAPRLRT